MDLVATTLVSDKAVHARFSDRSDLTTATHWFEFEIPLAELDIAARAADLRNSDVPFINAAKLAALRQLYAMIGAEIGRLQNECHSGG
jgi:hypothetical protein